MKKLILTLLCLLILTLAGCSSNRSHTNFSDQNITPNLTSLSENINDYYYVIDNNTGVVYLAFGTSSRAGITVMLKPDGTPMLAEDLGIKIGEKNEIK